VELSLVVDEAMRHVAKKRDEARDARAKREKLWATPRASAYDQLLQLSVFAAFASTKKDPAQAWKDLLLTKNPTPNERGLIATIIEMNIPVMGVASGMTFEQKRRELGLTDTVADAMVELAEVEREANHEIAETFSVLLAGISGASYSALGQLLHVDMTADERREISDKYGTAELESTMAFAAFARTALVSDVEEAAAAPRFEEQTAAPFVFMAAK